MGENRDSQHAISESAQHREAFISIDRTASTVTIAGRTFPAVALICPPLDGDDTYSDHERTLASGGGDQSAYIPAENGVLFGVDYGENERYRGLSLDLRARTCERVWSVDEWLYLPHDVSLLGGRLVPGDQGVHSWMWAEPGWVVETIDRLSRRPYQEPEGESARLVRLDHFTKESADA